MMFGLFGSVVSSRERVVRWRWRRRSVGWRGFGDGQVADNERNKVGRHEECHGELDKVSILNTPPQSELRESELQRMVEAVVAVGGRTARGSIHLRVEKTDPLNVVKIWVIVCAE